MALAYTLLAILGLIAFSLLTAWFIGKVLNYAAQRFEDREREFANAFGDVPAVHPEMWPARPIQAREDVAAELSERADTHNTHSVLLSGPLSGTGTL